MKPRKSCGISAWTYLYILSINRFYHNDDGLLMHFNKHIILIISYDTAHIKDHANIRGSLSLYDRHIIIRATSAKCSVHFIVEKKSCLFIIYMVWV